MAMDADMNADYQTKQLAQKYITQANTLQCASSMYSPGKNLLKHGREGILRKLTIDNW